MPHPQRQDVPEPSLATLALTSLPTAIWDKGHQALTMLEDASPEGLYNPSNFTKEMYQDAVAGLSDTPILNVEATSIAGAVNEFKKFVDIAVDQDNFSVILSPDRHFSV
ncbi:hypothetical protein H0H87_002680 [Tephrocybe sp. NHM501043]|nr:hypothetical protein H0H87_002680 [Tephrocybe sp. NHM501043]